MTGEWVSCVEVYKEEKQEAGSLIMLVGCILAQGCLSLDLLYMRENFKAQLCSIFLVCVCVCVSPI